MKVPIIMRAMSDLRLQQNVVAAVFVVIADDVVDPSSGRLLPILCGFDIPPPPPLLSWRWRSGNAVDDDFMVQVVKKLVPFQFQLL
jgi:hypothetical protein